jgi:nitrite reductase (NO-forming)
MIKAVQAVLGLGLLCLAATQVAVAQDISKLRLLKYAWKPQKN